VKATDLRELTDDELRQRMRERTDDLFSYRMQLATGTVENVRATRNARRDIARIKTLLRERELAAASGAK
jgi:large subunit ribosomal protein L29